MFQFLICYIWIDLIHINKSSLGPSIILKGVNRSLDQERQHCWVIHRLSRRSWLRKLKLISDTALPSSGSILCGTEGREHACVFWPPAVLPETFTGIKMFMVSAHRRNKTYRAAPPLCTVFSAGGSMGGCLWPMWVGPRCGLPSPPRFTCSPLSCYL